MWRTGDTGHVPDKLADVKKSGEQAGQEEVTLAQNNMQLIESLNDMGCVVAGLLVLSALIAGSVVAAYRQGFNRGRDSAIADESRRGFTPIPPADKTPPEPPP